MVIHAGIDLSEGRITVFTDNNGLQKYFDGYEIMKVDAFNIRFFDKVFQEFGRKVESKIDCVCIYLPECFSQYQGKVKKSVERYRFNKVELVDKTILKCMSALSQATNILRSTDIIWVCSVIDLYIWQKNICLAKYSIDNAEEFSMFCKISVLSPDVILYQVHMWGCVEVTSKLFPKCAFFKYDEYSVDHMALICARIMAGEIILFQDNPNITFLKKNANFHNPRSTEDNLGEATVFKGKRFPVPISFAKNDTFTLPTKFVTNNDEIKAVGIDLGTSRCCVAVNRRNGIETVPLDNNGERLLPSYVAYDEAHEKCGQIVIDRLRYHAKSSIFDSKRIIGKKMNDVDVDRNWPFTLKFAMNKSFIEYKNVNGAKARKTPEQIAATLLTHIKQKTEEFQGQKLDSVVITVPAAFTDEQREATILAATLAGWDSVHLLPEPTAAAFTYFIERSIPITCTLLVVDLGGGTLDVCVSKIENNKIKTIANSGDLQLGGRDFDNLLIDYFTQKLHDNYGVFIDDAKKYKLMLECQKIKQYLSLRNQEQLDVEDFDHAKSGVISITQEIFEELSKELLTRIENTITAALNASKLNNEQIEKVLQVGGGSRMPMIKKLLCEMFSNAEHCCEKHPEEVVAIGAAYYAYNIFSS